MPVAARTDDIDLAFMGNVSSDPGNSVRGAEELAMLNNMSDGCIVSEFVRDISAEYTVYNVDIGESCGRFEETWDRIFEYSVQFDISMRGLHRSDGGRHTTHTSRAG